MRPKQKLSPEKFNDRRPVIEYVYGKKKDMNWGHVKIYVLDEGESLPMNSSTNYDHHYEGSAMIAVQKNQMHTNRHESWANDFEAWSNVDFLVNMGLKYLDGITHAESNEARKIFEEERSKRKPLTSIHQK